VDSEHGRPDDGTDQTVFFNAEFFVALKPYSEWNGPYHSKPELIDAIDHYKNFLFEHGFLASNFDINAWVDRRPFEALSARAAA